MYHVDHFSECSSVALSTFTVFYFFIFIYLYGRAGSSLQRVVWIEPGHPALRVQSLSHWTPGKSQDPNSLVQPPRSFTAILISCSFPCIPQAQGPWSCQQSLRVTPRGCPQPLTRSVALAVFGHQVCLWLFHPAAENSLG